MSNRPQPANPELEKIETFLLVNALEITEPYRAVPSQNPGSRREGNQRRTYPAESLPRTFAGRLAPDHHRGRVSKPGARSKIQRKHKKGVDMTEIVVLPAASISGDLAAIQSELAEVRRLLETMLSAPKQSPWMTAREVCEYRRFSETTLRAKVKAGEITKHITPDGVRYRRDEVEAVKRIV